MSKKNKVTSYSSDSEEIARMIKVLAFVILSFLLFYFVFALASGEIKFGGKSKEEVQIQNIEILAGSTFNRPESNYIVLLYDFDSDESISMAALYDLYASVGSKKIYVVDLHKKFNSKYVVENASEVNANNIDSLKVVNPTLIEVNDGVGTTYKTGYEEINKYLFNK